MLNTHIQKFNNWLKQKKHKFKLFLDGVDDIRTGRIKTKLNIKIFRDKREINYGTVSKKLITYQGMEFIKEVLTAEKIQNSSFVILTRVLKSEIGNSTTPESRDDTSLGNKLFDATNVNTEIFVDTTNYIATIKFFSDFNIMYPCSITEYGLYVYYALKHSQSSEPYYSKTVLFDRAVFPEIYVYDDDVIKTEYIIQIQY